MKDNNINRRKFLNKTLTLAGGTLFLKNTYASVFPVHSTGSIKIEHPFHGAILNRRQGEEVDGRLKIKIKGKAPLRSDVRVNGISAKRRGVDFEAEIYLQNEVTPITAQSDGLFGQNEHEIKVLWDRNSFPRYRFAIDDNIYFLRDIVQKNYRSIFECFYLEKLKKLNSDYGTRFILNIFYAAEDGFDLSHFPEKYRNEWRDNSDWLRLAFHAHAEMPDRPYQYASPRKLLTDLDRVAEQIHRFAGEETYSPPKIIHWGMVNPEALTHLNEKGVNVLSGYFQEGYGGWDVNYGFDDVRSEYLSRNEALMDYDSGIIFSKIDLICNATPDNQIAPVLEKLRNDPNQAEVMDFLTHEQYFWPFYKNYIPDHFHRLETAIRWVTEEGYKPVFFEDGYLID